METFLKEVLWREFAAYLLWHHPDMPTTPLRAEFAKFPWSKNKNSLTAWQQGQIGIPIVDAAPYFRIFNPVLQGRKFDPDGTYVRKYVPELKNLPNKYIHSPWEAAQHILETAHVKLGESHPRPIVDLSEGRERALAAYKKITRSQG